MTDKRQWWIIKHLIKFKKRSKCSLGLRCKANNEKHFRLKRHSLIK